MEIHPQFLPYRPAAIVDVAGEDADSFLQGQFTNDLRREPGAAVYGLFLNQKGKVVADCHALKLAPNHWKLASRGCTAPELVRRLSDYVVADDVAIADETAAGAGISLYGEGAGALLAVALGQEIPAGEFARAGELLVFRGRLGREDTFEIIGSESACGAGADRLSAAGCTRASQADMEFFRIRERMPAVPQDLGLGDLPNEGGIQGATISTTKGCYLGQEVMARLMNLGQVRRRLFVVAGEGAAPAPHTALFQHGRKIGETRSAAASVGHYLAMAMLSLANLDERAGLALQPDGAALIRILDRV